MKNIAILFLSSFFVLSSFSSCKKCAHCETAGVKSNQFCGSTGVSTNDVYSTQKTKCENNGGSWIIE
jgi:hypothetical protein